MANKLTSRVAIVTGAAQGIGESIARLFAQEDCFVYVTDINDELGRTVAQATSSCMVTSIAQVSG